MRIVVPTNKGSRFGFEILDEFLTHKRRPAEVPDRGGARKDELKSLRSAGSIAIVAIRAALGTRLRASFRRRRTVKTALLKQLLSATCIGAIEESPRGHFTA